MEKKGKKERTGWDLYSQPHHRTLVYKSLITVEVNVKRKKEGGKKKSRTKRFKLSPIETRILLFRLLRIMKCIEGN